MPHFITCLLVQGAYDKDVAARFELFGIDLGNDLTMFHIDHYYSACWQKQLGTAGYLQQGAIPCGLICPQEAVLAHLTESITRDPLRLFAILVTDYFGGVGNQWACVYQGLSIVDAEIKTINQALRRLGVRASAPLDEFDTVGLGQHRSPPDFLEKYVELSEVLGV